MDQKKRTILYVDDNNVNLVLLQESFKNEYNILIAESGKAALEIFKNNEVNLVLADLMMPEMSGIEFLEKVIEINALPPRILLTAYGSFESVQEAVNRSKIYQFVQKPWNKKELTLIIEHALRSYDIQIENQLLNQQLLEKTQKLEQELLWKDELNHKIKESEEKFFTIFNSSPDAISLTSLETGEIIDVNTQFAEMMGMQKENLIGKTTIDIGFWVDQEDRLPFYDLLKTNGKILNYETPINRNAKQKKVALISGELVTIHNDKFILVLVRDISEIKQREEEIRLLNEGLEEKVKERTAEYRESEQKFRELLQFIPDGILLIDKNGKVVLTNDETEQIFGYDKYDVVNHNLGMLFPERFRSTVQNHIEQITQNFVESYVEGGFEITGARRNAEEFPLEMKTDVVLFESEPHVISIIRDVSEKRKSEEKLHHAMKIAETANKTKSEFLANMSHEIRTPLNAVLGITDLLYQQIDDEIQRSYLNTIKSSSKSLLTILNDILDFSKIEAGKLELNYGYFNLSDTLKELEGLFYSKTQEKKIDIVLDLPDIFPNLVYLDEIRIRQVLTNLLSNAIKFTDTGYVKLGAELVGAMDMDEGQTELRIFVEDTGIGIDEDFKKHIFDEFSQQDGQDSKKYGGSGLGLAISNKLIGMMHGEIRIESVKHKGSVFSLVFPSVTYSNSKDRTSQAKIDFVKKNFLPSTLVIAGKNNEQVKMLQGAFTETAVSVFTASDGTKAYELATMLSPHLIIVDLAMSDSIRDFCLNIKETPSLENILILGYSDNYSERQLKDLDECFDKIIRYPIQLVSLFTVLQSYLPYSNFENVDAACKDGECGQIKEVARVELEEQTGDLWENLQKQQKIKQVEEFANIIKSLGEKHEEKSLLNYSAEINAAIKAFDIKTILKLLAKYKDFID